MNTDNKVILFLQSLPIWVKVLAFIAAILVVLVVVLFAFFALSYFRLYVDVIESIVSDL